jgi:hypothetical protein
VDPIQERPGFDPDRRESGRVFRGQPAPDERKRFIFDGSHVASTATMPPAKLARSVDKTARTSDTWVGQLCSFDGVTMMSSYEEKAARVAEAPKRRARLRRRTLGVVMVEYTFLLVGFGVPVILATTAAGITMISAYGTIRNDLLHKGP